jgi:dTDP-4-dehydrorhamnose reductase
MKILVLGASGLIGSTIFKVLSKNSTLKVFGTFRSNHEKIFFENLSANCITGIDVSVITSVQKCIERLKPDVVINCIGITKHHISDKSDPLNIFLLNSFFPYQLAEITNLVGSRLIHISTDCVFSGSKGNYTELDNPDALDLYGRGKALGEIQHYPHVVTLRTSTIGHELNSSFGLLDWFLMQGQICQGYTHAIFSGLPTVILAKIIGEFVIPNQDLSGLYNVASKPINKYDLLSLISETYQKKINIIPNNELVIDRSLNPKKFELATNYIAPSWPELIKIMHENR